MVKITLREIRNARHITILKLSSLSGVSSGHISDIETGKKSPTIDILIKIAIALRCKPEELYSYDIKYF